VTKHLIQSAKLIALFGAIVLVVWSMPDRPIADPEPMYPVTVSADATVNPTATSLPVR
jgi:hypothetical protein